MAQYEVEIKVLLGEKEKADKFRSEINDRFEGLKLVDTNSQLNHYFVWWDFTILREKLDWKIPEDKLKSFDNMIKEWKSFSVRTRFVNNISILVVKFSVDDTSSENGTARREWEHEFDMWIDELDNMLLDSSFEYQAKWSRQREEYSAGDMNICLDKNAGYGYLAEFEKVLDLDSDYQEAKKEIRDIIESLWYTELDQSRLERMFSFYNDNWRDYYGTEKTFVID